MSTAGSRQRAPRRARTGAPAGLPARLAGALPRDLLNTEPQELNGPLPRWPDGPFLPELRWRHPDLYLHLVQVAGLARDAQLFREGRGWTRARLAELARLNEQTYGDFEAGRSWPAATTLYRAAEALDTDLRLVDAAGRLPVGPRPRPVRLRTGGTPARLEDLAPRDLLGAAPLEGGRGAQWPEGPVPPLPPQYWHLGAHLRQIAGLARDAQQLRAWRGWTRKQLAGTARIDGQTYGDFEAGRTWPVPATLYRVAGALQVRLGLAGRPA